MSWWIYLEDPETGEVAEVENFSAGGTQVVGGSTRAELNVTYNYGEVCCCAQVGNLPLHYAIEDEALGWQPSEDDTPTWFHFRRLAGLRGRNTIPTLAKFVERCGTQTFSDYWAPTPGNAGAAAAILLEWARQHPEYVWRVS
jgi:hypothetical protein